MKKWALILLTPLSLLADAPELKRSPDAAEPWFTGPLLANSATTVPVGHWNIEPYFFFTKTPAAYQDDWKSKSITPLWNLAFQPYMWVGITEWLDIQLNPTLNWNYREGPSAWTFGDFPVKLEFQIYRDDLPHKSWIPSIKFSVAEVFPTGKYKNLNPNKKLTDLSGMGAYTTNFQLAIGRAIQIKGYQWVELRLNLDYLISAPVHIKGYNAYGGAYDTNGKIHTTQMAEVDISIEYSLTRNWALACDFAYQYQQGRKFTGKAGDLPAGVLAVDRTLPLSQYSVAPAIEYMFSANLGIVAGTWFTFAGKNSPEFYTGMIAVNYYQ